MCIVIRFEDIIDGIGQVTSSFVPIIYIHERFHKIYNVIYFDKRIFNLKKFFPYIIPYIIYETNELNYLKWENGSY